MLEMSLAYPDTVEAEVLGAFDQPQRLLMAGLRIRRVELSDRQEPEAAQWHSMFRHACDAMAHNVAGLAASRITAASSRTGHRSCAIRPARCA